MWLKRQLQKIAVNSDTENEKVVVGVFLVDCCMGLNPESTKLRDEVSIFS